MARILIIDDDLCPVLSIILNEFGYEPLTAENGKEGLEALSQNPDLALVDNEMPIMSGPEFVKNIKHNPEYSKYSKLPLIAIGQDFSKEILSEFDAYIPIPFDNQELVDTIKKTLS